MKDMERKKIVIALFGRSGAGKDSLLRTTIENDESLYNKIIHTTTRPMREGEIDGVDYFFKTSIDAKDSYTINMYNNWAYGLDKNQIKEDKVNIGIFNLKEIPELIRSDELEVYPIYIKVDDGILLRRCMSRERHPNYSEICRRFLSDEEDFKNITFQYHTFENYDYIDLYKFNSYIQKLGLDLSFLN